MADDVTSRLTAVEALLSELRAEVIDLRAENADLRAAVSDPPDTGTSGPTDPAGLGRRHLLVGGVTAGAAAVAGLVATASPVAAADGDDLKLGAANTSTAQTVLTYASTAQNGFRVRGGSSQASLRGEQTGSGPAVQAETTGAGPAVLGVAADGQGIFGSSVSGSGVFGASQLGPGVYGEGPIYGVAGLATDAEDGIAVYGQSNAIGVYGICPGTGIGVAALSADGTGVQARSGLGTGLTVEGVTTLHLISKAARTAPTDDATGHTVGEVVIDSSGAVWLCTGSGTPGTWRKLGGPATSGQLHVLPAPARVYDSRPNTPPSVGPKTKFAANETRTFDLKVNGSTVPAGATAALVTILLVNASTTAGNATIWANGLTKPLANTMVWGGTAGRFTATATTALDTQARIQFNASQPTNLVLDVVGFYR